MTIYRNLDQSYSGLAHYIVQWCSRNSKSHFAGNLLANRRTNLTLIVRLGAKSDLLIEQLLISEHYCI